MTACKSSAVDVAQRSLRVLRRPRTAWAGLSKRRLQACAKPCRWGRQRHAVHTNEADADLARSSTVHRQGRSLGDSAKRRNHSEGTGPVRSGPSVPDYIVMHSDPKVRDNLHALLENLL